MLPHTVRARHIEAMVRQRFTDMLYGTWYRAASSTTAIHLSKQVRYSGVMQPWVSKSKGYLSFLRGTTKPCIRHVASLEVLIVHCRGTAQKRG